MNQLELFVAVAWLVKDCNVILENTNNSKLCLKIIKLSSNDEVFCVEIDPFDTEKVPELEKSIGEYIKRR